VSPLPDPRRLHRPHGGASESPEDDPTGVRNLLAGLRDPGPMPPELSARISAALADEQTRREAELHEVINLTEHRRRRSRWILPAAAAAAVVVAGGGLVLNGLGGFGGSQSAGGGTMSAASVSQYSGAESAAGTADQATPHARDAAKPSTSSGEAKSQANTPRPLASAAVEAAGVGAVVVSFSNRPYAVASLATDAADLRDTPQPPARSGASESPGVGPLATEAGARACADALGIAPRAPVVVDLGTIDGQPGALVLVVGTGGESTAYAVGRDCGQGSPMLIAGPVRVA
jgi:hypothetical protein